MNLNLNMKNIDWALLSDAQQYYENNGYIYQETPYIVPLEVNEITKPHDEPSFILQNGIFSNTLGELVGSAEQGFIYLLLNNSLYHNKLSSITPCFRSDKYDDLHQPWFMKLELFHLSNDVSDLMEMIDTAHFFFSKYKSKNDFLQTIKTGDYMYDILLNDIEIGSYGLREVGNFNFFYGTGLALPRFSIAKI
jgi:elongation factor P--beta-lysine ligase